MSTVRSALIQTYGSMSMEENVERQIALIEQAAKQGAQITCLQELATGPYFCQVQDPKYYSFAEPVPDGPTVKRMQEVAKKHEMVLVVPLYEMEQTGVYYNTAAVIDADGTLPRQVSQDAHPAGQGLLGEVLLPPRQPGLSHLPDTLRAHRRLHLLRPPLPRRRARARPERRRDRLHPLGDLARPLEPPLEDRAGLARHRQRLLGRHDQPRRRRAAG